MKTQQNNRRPSPRCMGATLRPHPVRRRALTAPVLDTEDIEEIARRTCDLLEERGVGMPVRYFDAAQFARVLGVDREWVPRAATGSILTLTLADGTRKFRLRFQAHGERQNLVLHERAGCACGCGGGWDERSARTELGNVIARVRAGVWKRPTKTLDPGIAVGVPTFHEYASDWLARKIDGVSTNRRLAAATISHYRTVLACHLLPYFAEHRLDEIDRRVCLAF
jgi:hypothetical protein